MSALQQLSEWYTNALQEGSVTDVKFFPGSDTKATPEEVAAFVLGLLNGKEDVIKIESVDALNDPDVAAGILA